MQNTDHKTVKERVEAELWPENERQARHLVCDCSNFGSHLPDPQQHSKSCYYRTKHGSRLVETLTMTLDGRDKRHAQALIDSLRSAATGCWFCPFHEKIVGREFVPHQDNEICCAHHPLIHCNK